MLASHENLAMLRIAVAQLNPIMGDIAGNLTKARAARAEAARMKADLILFTELFVSYKQYGVVDDFGKGPKYRSS